LATFDLKAGLESLLLVADQPLRIEKMVELTEVDKANVKQAIEELQTEYAEREGGILLEQVAGGYQLRTPVEHAELIRKLAKVKATRFSRAALETLAIIAYRQPITRAEVEYLRGVDSGGVVKTLLDKRLVKILGKKDIPGRPLIYGTSRDFLEAFGLKDLADLPTLKEFSDLEPEALGVVDALEGTRLPDQESEPTSHIDRLQEEPG
jgi:segregation and condensation protein B